MSQRIGYREIYDEDGDGVEDNVEKTRDELDRFYDPNVYGDAGDADIYNTHHGDMPGHVRKSEYEGAPVREDQFDYGVFKDHDTSIDGWY